MGLLDALKKRKLGGGAGGASKRACAAAAAANGSAQPPADPTEELRRRLANGGFAALVASHKSKNTRTAHRKQRKAEAAARAAAAQQRRHEAAAADRRQRHPAGSDSDGEAGDAAAAAAATGSVAIDGQEAERQQTAYTRLLGSLGSGGGAFASVLQQRQREQAGDSDISDDEEEEGSDGQDDEEGGSGSELGSDESDEEEELGSDGEELEGSQQEEDGGSGDDDEAAAAAHANGHAGGGSSQAEEEAEEQQQQQVAANGRGAQGQAGAAAAAPVEDHYLEHFDRELSEAEAAALLDGGAQSTRYLDCCAAGKRRARGGSKGGEQGPAVPAELLHQWPDATLQAAEGTRLPQSLPSDLGAYGVKERLAARWREVASPAAAPAAAAQGSTAAAAAADAAGGEGDFVSAQQQALFSLLSTYSDLLLPCRPYPTAADAPDPLLDAVLLHALSHCAKAADRIKKNNDRLRGARDQGAPALDAVPKDQGFTRAKVLLLLPQRNLALRVVSRLLALAVRETRTDTIQHKQRFLEEFGEEDEELTEREAAAVARKPPEHRALFKGNTDDHFRLGIKLTRGAVKLFADFFDSDIIVASPIALATRLAEAGDDGAADFLSSVEILVAERADVMLMQNWAHVATVLDSLNRIPKDGHGVDMMRVRDWALSGHGALYRQTVLLGSFASAEMNALLARACRNAAGKVRLRPTPAGVLGQVIPQARQVFERLPGEGVGGPGGDADARFAHFKAALWPRIRESGRSGGHLIYIPSYFDYVRVRNYLREEMAPFLGLCEYTDRADAARARSYFFDRRKRVLLYTERAQFYNRHRIRGAQDILFYQLPEHPQFYSELLNLMEEGGTGESPTVTAVFSRYDALRLERVVGAARAAKMLKQRKTGTFLFC